MTPQQMARADHEAGMREQRKNALLEGFGLRRTAPPMNYNY
jgi:hypothetical protein